MYQNIEQSVKEILKILSTNIAKRLDEVNLIPTAVPHEITNAWADLGGEVLMEHKTKGALYINLDIGTSTDVQVRILGKRVPTGTDEYVLPIKTITPSEVKVEDEYIEFNNDVDQNMIIGFETEGLIPYVQVQVKDSAGGTGQIDSAYLKRY